MMNAALNNLVGLHQDTVGEDIQAFLSKYKKKNESTSVIYEKAIRMFFMWYRSKELNELTTDDIIVKNATIIRYQTHLEENTPYSNTTINKFMAPIFSLYEFLETNDYPVKKASVKVDALDVDDNKHGEMNDAEAKLVREFVLTQKKGVEKAALIKLAARTSFRKSAILNLTWGDIKKHKHNDYYEVTVIDKGKKSNTKPISEEFYKELLEIKEQQYYNRYNDNKIFHLSKTTIQSMFKGINEQFNFNDDKGVVFHSLRNVMTGWIEETGGSIEDMREQLNQSGYGSLKHYIHGKDLSNSPSLRIEKEVSDNIFEGLSKEELIMLITSQQGGIVSTLKSGAQKMIDRKESKIN
ncbi:tyrosine-type recombinase/integrase [Paenibacillus donghaensis]|nr:site-specific integrase [Paenibacillus donghaensis]